MTSTSSLGPEATSQPRFNDLLPGRCPQHSHPRHPAPCSACMRAQQARLRAHYEASVAAARVWRHGNAAPAANATVS
jgi:hypothetical protein